MKCVLCENENPEKILVSDYFCVTSDLRRTYYRNEKWECLNCGLIQTKTSKDWKRKVLEIYNEYSAFEVSNHDEQKVFLGATQKYRSDVIIENVLKLIGTRKNGLILVAEMGLSVT